MTGGSKQRDRTWCCSVGFDLWSLNNSVVQWGDQNDTVAIVLNGKEAQVSRNLECVLRAFSTTSNFTAGYKLWVDALCINQNDYKERGRQIQKMRTIYGSSWSVIAWIGEESEDSSKACRLIERLGLEHRAGRGAALKVELENNNGFLGEGCWFALQYLVERKYWYRLWVIQEIILGGLSTVIQCGKDSVDWGTFLDAINLLFDHLWELKDDLLANDAALYWGARGEDVLWVDIKRWSTLSLHLIRRELRYMTSCEEEKGGNFLDLPQLLSIAQSAKCRDKRDLVYGLVGLMDPAISGQLDPDYTILPPEVFAKVAKAFIVTHGNLDPIRYGNPWGPFENASWAADWKYKGRIRYSEPRLRPHGPFWTNVSMDDQLEPRLRYHASANLAPSGLSFSSDGERLSCDGIVVDQITAIGGHSLGYLNGWDVVSVVQDASWTSAYGDDTATALYRTLLLDRVAYGERASERHRAIFSLPSRFQRVAKPQFRHLGWKWLSEQEGYYFRWEMWRAAHNHFLVSGRRLDEYFTDIIPRYASEYDYTEVYACFDRTCKNRRFILTQNGYMGWAPDNCNGGDDEQTRQGDLIAIIFGCSTPIVLRPVEDDGNNRKYQVLGEAYVQGLMDGEGIAWLESGRFQAEKFVFI